MRIKNFLVLAITLLLLVSFGCDRQENLGDDPAANWARVIFALTDAPEDELSVLQVDLTEMKITDINGIETLIFSAVEGEIFVLNLLNLQDLNALLGSVPLAPGYYKELHLNYENAVALDTDYNSLTVKENHYGSAKVLLNPYLAVGEENVYVEIDFDVNNSVFNIVSGPHGSLLLMPTLIVKVGPPDEDPEIDEFKGTIESVEAMSMVVTLNDETINIALTESTVLEIDELFTTPAVEGFDLTLLLLPGNIVEVKGTLDVDTNTVTATWIERKIENHGLESQGLVVALGDFANGDFSFNLLVLDPKDSGFEPGSIQNILFDANTIFLYIDPPEIAAADQLALGQKVRVTGIPEEAAFAQKIKLRETKLCGTVVSTHPDAKQVVFNVARICGIDVENFPGFINPVTVEFVNDFPTTLEADAETKFEGFFNRVTMDTFAVYVYEEEEDDDEEGDGEGSTWVGKTFSVISSSPLQISITRGDSAQTCTVVMGAGVAIVEKDRSVTTQISEAELGANINAGKYDKMKAKGSYDSATKTLTASQIVMDVDKK
ncbi:MAG: DUF4382 domain-containing protein [Candidatus Aminicenantes bacterium]|nr:DUF4382 domain-containing protein [Candidatus Aminicenantes bacterium]